MKNYQLLAALKDIPAIEAGEKLDPGISYEDALKLLKKYNEDEFHISHGETVGKLMAYYAEKFDPENVDFWRIVGLLHDLDWEKWPSDKDHTIKTAELLEEAGVNPKVSRAIQTHTSDYNPDLPAPEHKMEKVLWAVDELSGLIAATVAIYPSKSSADLNLRSLKKKFKNKKFAAGCDRDYMRKGAEMNGLEIEELLESMIEATQTIDGTK